MSEKKLIIDEDWKSQVQAEKEAAANASSQSSTGDEPASAGAKSAPAKGGIQMPPASLEMLVTTLATEALVALGQVPHPATGELVAQRSQAQYLIDTVDVLREKTKGNLTPDEQHMIDGVLHQLRMAFLETTDAPLSAPT